MDVFEALYTTRAMRRVSEDPIPDDVLKNVIANTVKRGGKILMPTLGSGRAQEIMIAWL